MLKYLVALVFLTLAVPSASAATLVNASGDVQVNTGRGFVRGTEGQQLKPGDRVMVGRSGGSATISYDPTCTERVEQGRMAVVQRGVPCSTPVANAASTAAAASTGGGIGQGALIIGGAAAAVGAGVLIYNSTKKNSSP